MQVILTPNARDFVTPLTLSTLSKRPALTETFSEVDGTWNSHVDMGNWADLMLIAPASASTLSKMATGQADNLLVTTYLSAKCPVFFAPAMDLDMFKHPTTVQSIEKLVSFGHHLIEPQVGELASGLSGAGRLEEPEQILEIIMDFFKKKKQFSNKKILVTAGPTYEAIDPVRFIGNYSSGLMGFEIAREAAERGADVTLISGPTHLNVGHPAIKRIDVVSASQMLEACNKEFQDVDITIMAAAVADFTPAIVSDSKIKKETSLNSIQLKPTTDILSTLGQQKKNHQLLVGFALETNAELENARKKLKNKNLDLIVLNSLKDEGAGFGVTTNKITIIGKNNLQIDYPLKTKREVASDILDQLAGFF